MSAPPKTLSPAELAKLEHAFATDPSSAAYRPLAEAYLGMGRFMEAMVVCKKGVKAHPDLADPRVLLARVYADQGKEKKALEELAGALQIAPTDKTALRMTGHLQIKAGEMDPGKANLLKALEVDSNDNDTLELLKQHSIPLPTKPVAAAPAALAPPMLQPVSESGSSTSAAAAPAVHHHAVHHEAPASAVARQPVALASAAKGAEGVAVASAPRPKKAAAARTAYVADDEDEYSGRRSRQKKTGSPMVTVVILVVAIAGGGGFAWWRNRQAEINKIAGTALRAAAAELKHDSYDSYKKAIEQAEKALDARDDSVAAHGMLAYAHAIRWGEHGGGDEDRKAAEDHLARGLKTHDKSAWLYAAEGLIPFYSGKSKDALERLKKRIEETQGRSGQLFLTQAIIMMNDGDLEGAKEAIEKAQQINQDDARVYAAFGNLNRRRGLDREALQNFDTAKRFERNHVDSILGTALLVLDQPEPAGGYISQAKALKDVIEAQPPPSPRQLALAYVTKGLMISRVSIDLPLYVDAEFKKKLQEGTGVSTSADKNKADAVAAETQGFNLDRNNPELHLIRGKRQFFEGHLEAAVEDIQKAIAMSATRVHYRIELGKVLMSKEGMEKQAEAELRKGLAAFPDNMKLQTMLGSVLYKEKRIDEAVTALEQATKAARDPSTRQRNPDGLYMLGKIYRDEKKAPDKAIEYLATAAQQSFGNPRAASNIYDELSTLYEQKNDSGAARANLEKALNADSDNEVSVCHFIRFLKKSGNAKDQERIKELSKKYQELAPKGDCQS